MTPDLYPFAIQALAVSAASLTFTRTKITVQIHDCCLTCIPILGQLLE